MAEKLSAASNLDSIQLQEQASVGSTPGSGYGKLICLTDGTLHYVNDAGTDVDLSTGAGATTELDNLTTTAINAHLLPDTNSTYDLASTAGYWRASYIDTMYLSEQSEPSTPASTKGVLYITSGSLLHFKNDAGQVYDLTSGIAQRLTQSHFLGSHVSTSSTSYAEASSTYRISITTAGGDCYAEASFFADATAGTGGVFRLVLHDGSSNVVADNDSDASAAETDYRLAAVGGVTLRAKWSSLAADTYTLRIEYKANGSSTIRLSGVTTPVTMMIVEES